MNDELMHWEPTNNEQRAVIVTSSDSNRESHDADFARMSAKDRSDCMQDRYLLGIYVYEKVGETVTRIDPRSVALKFTEDRSRVISATKVPLRYRSTQ